MSDFVSGKAGPHVVRSISEYNKQEEEEKKTLFTDPALRSVEEEEMKTLFTDPALRKLEEEDRRALDNHSHHCSCSFSCNKDTTTIVSGTVSQKADDEHKLYVANNNLMTRRITIAGGFLDMALFTANIEQLKFVLELGPYYIYYKQVLGLIITSLVLQMLVGLTMFLLGCHVIKKIDDETYSTFLNHLTMGLVALITIVNIFISTFGPKGTALAMCLGAFSVRNTSSPPWKAYVMNFTEPRIDFG